jgi:hypothetical protein
MAKVREVLKRAEIHILPEVGHLPHHERAEETVGVILKHLSQAAAPARSPTAL